MFSIIALSVGGLLVVGFYGYVFVHLYTEFVKHRVSRGSLDSHLSVITSAPAKENAPDAESSATHRAPFPNDNLLNVAIAAFGLVGLCAEIVVLNGLLASSH